MDCAGNGAPDADGPRANLPPPHILMTRAPVAKIMTPGFQPPDHERAVGLAFYATLSPGTQGVLKANAESFRVREISAYPVPDSQGRFVVVRVESRNWEQHELASMLARRLGLASNSVRWAGTKDRRAVTERLFSYIGPLPPADLHLSDATILEAYRARDGLSLGHHYGNAFEVRVAGLAVPAEDASTVFREVRQELELAGRFPDLFGLQRFGEVRPVTHEVGRALVHGRVDEAVDIYLARIPPGEDPARSPARAAYAVDHDAVRALQDFPREYRFERSMLEHLARGHPAERAFRALNRELRLLFVHAYQSLLFNRWVSLRHAAAIPLNEPEEGDYVLRAGRDGTLRGQDAIPVDRDNAPECTDLARRGRAVVAGPLIGFETRSRPGRVGELLERILAEEGVAPQQFELPHTPDISSAGAWRPATLALPPIGITPDRTPEGGDGVWFRFALPKGAYATVLLREFLKTGASA